MSHFVSTSGADFDDLHHQLLQRQPVEGTGKDEEELERSLHEHSFQSTVDQDTSSVEEDGSDATHAAETAAGPTGVVSSGSTAAHIISPALASRRRPDLSRPTSFAEQQQSDLPSRTSSPFGVDSDGNEKHRNRAASASQSRPKRGRKLSDPDDEPLIAPAKATTRIGVQSGTSTPVGDRQTRWNSGEASSAQSQAPTSAAPSPLPPSARHRQKEVTFDESAAATSSSSSSDDKRGLTRSNSNVADMRSRHHQRHHDPRSQFPLDGDEQGRQHHVLSAHAQSRLRSAGMISQAEMPPRKLGTWDGVFMPVSLNILGIILFLRFGFILGQVGLVGALVLLTLSYAVDTLTVMSVSAISTNGQVRGGGAYYLISRSLGPEFGGSIGLIFFGGQALNATMNVLGFVESLTDAFGESRGPGGFLPEGTWWNFSYGSVCLLVSTLVCLVGSRLFVRATLALAVVLGFAILSIPLSSVLVAPFIDEDRGAFYTGWKLETLRENLMPHFTSGAAGSSTGPLKENWQTVFGVLFPAVTGILAGASMSGDLRKPSKSISKGTNWSLIFTYGVYVMSFIVFAGTIARQSFYLDVGIVSDVALSPQIITFGVLASTTFSALMGVMACGKVLQAIARDNLLPALDIFAQGTEVSDTPTYAVVATWVFCQAVLFVDSVNLIAQLVTMTSLLTFGTLSFATLALKAGGAPSFRPSFRYWNIYTAGGGALASFGAMFFTDPFWAATCIFLAIFLFTAISIFCPPKPWGDTTRNIHYYIVRKYLLRLDERKGRVTHWRPQILLLSNNPRTEWNLIIFCNSLKKGALYVLGHVLKGEFGECLGELRKQQIAWLKLVDVSGIKSFVDVVIAPNEREGARNLILSCGLGGMRPNIVCLGFPTNIRNVARLKPASGQSSGNVSPISASTLASRAGGASAESDITIRGVHEQMDRHRALMNNGRVLPTDVARRETPITASTYVGIMEDTLALQKALAVAYGFDNMQLSSPSSPHRQWKWTEWAKADAQEKKEPEKHYIDLWPIQIQSPDADPTHAWDSYTMVLQLGTILSLTGSWKKHKLRVSVFVEYESDVEDERRRVRSLLDNLRVPASLRVFHLSSGTNKSYQAIVHGRGPSPASIETALGGDPWWEALKQLRKEEERRSKEAAAAAAAAAKKRAVPSAMPFPDSSGGSNATAAGVRKQSKREQKLLGVSLPAEHLEFFKRNMQIGLAHPRAKKISSKARAAADRDGGKRRTRSTSGALEEGTAEHLRRGNLGSSLGSETEDSDEEESDSDEESDLSDELASLNLDDIDWVGSAGSGTTGNGLRRTKTYGGANSTTSNSHRKIKEANQRLLPRRQRTYSVGQKGHGTPFASAAAPGPSSSSYGSFGSTPRANNTSIKEEDFSTRRPRGGRLTSSSTLSSASSSAAEEEDGEEIDDDDGTLKASDRARAQAELERRERQSRDEEPTKESFDTVSVSTHVQFNSLPNKAQYLILNELIRVNSDAMTTVVLTALPAPEPGTSSDEGRSQRYLDQLESLFANAPPVLGVHAKQLTMTSAL